MAVADAAWTAGEIDSAHVATLGSACTSHAAETYARDEAPLVDEARSLRFDDFARVVNSPAEPTG